MLQVEKYILNKYTNEAASVVEQASVVEKLFRSKKVLGVKRCVQNDWNDYFKANNVIDKDLGIVLDKVHHYINLSESKRKLKFSSRLYGWYSAVVAVVVVPLVALGALSILKLGNVNQLLSEKASVVSISSPFGVRTAFELPDGSDVVLNGGSSIKYSVPFSNKRNVELLGEAYFDVTHDENNPFVVSTDQIDVKVLGTRFNINAFIGDDVTEVILEEGEVECFLGNKKVVMQPNERFSLIGRKYTKTNVNASKYTAWRDGELIFRGDSMGEVAKRISSWYDVEVDVQGGELATYSFRATFQDDSLEEVLRLLKISSPIDYKITSSVKQSDGSFSRKKILLYKKI